MKTQNFLANIVLVIFELMAEPLMANTDRQTFPSKEQQDSYASEGFTSPCGDLSFYTLQNTNEKDHDAFIQLVKKSSKTVLFSMHESYAHGIHALWSPKSNFIAVSMKTHPNSEQAKIFRVTHDKLSELPQSQILDVKSILSKNDPAKNLVFRNTGVSFIEWKNSHELVCEIEGVTPVIDTKAAAVGNMVTQDYITVKYRLIIRCDDTATILKTKRIK